LFFDHSISYSLLYHAENLIKPKTQIYERGQKHLTVGRVGLEPTWCLHRRILSPLRLPIPPPPHGLQCCALFYHYPANSGIDLFIEAIRDKMQIEERGYNEFILIISIMGGILAF
jgi:hypothetical protein